MNKHVTPTNSQPKPRSGRVIKLSENGKQVTLPKPNLGRAIKKGNF